MKQIHTRFLFHKKIPNRDPVQQEYITKFEGDNLKHFFGNSLKIVGEIRSHKSGLTNLEAWVSPYNGLLNIKVYNSVDHQKITKNGMA